MKLKSNKFFGIGLSRTATDSLHHAFEMMGLKSIHLPDREQVKNLSEYQFADDISVATRFKEIDKQFPNSKFIYTVRDMDKWLVSCESFWNGMDEWLTYLENNKNNLTLKDQIEFQSYELIKTYGTIRFDKNVFIKTYKNHDKNVRSYFRNRPDDLLIMNICQGDGWDKLLPFITNDNVISNDLFPCTNVKSTFLQQNAANYYHNKKKCVATVCDKNFLIGLETMVFSLLKHNPQFNWDIVILSPDLMPEDLGRLTALYPFIRLIRLDTEKYNNVNEKLMAIKPGANGAYYKYDVFGLEEYDRVLFLDCDTLIMQNLWELFAIKEDIAMCPELFISQLNTGVMSIGKKYLGKDIVRKLIGKTMEIGPTDHVDQDIINILFHGRIKKIPIDFNFLKIYHNYSFMGEISPHIKILHYVIHKPWTSYQPLTIEEGCGWLDKYWKAEHNELIKKFNS